MSIIEAAAVSTDRIACARVADLLRHQEVPLDREEIELAGLAPTEIGNFYFFLVAVCHQTSPRGGPVLEGSVRGKRRRGWDYLIAKFEIAVRDNPSILRTSTWESMTEADFRDIFAERGSELAISDVTGRTELVNDLGKVMGCHGWTWLEDLYRICGGRATTGGSNLFDLLSLFRAYDDPVRKKSSFLLSLMRNSGLWSYVDNDKIGPPVDYHEVRGHLRIGTVTVNDCDLRRKLLAHLPVTADEDVAIRQAVSDAIVLISDLSGLKNPSQLHYLFWNVFRSCCKRESPHCGGCPADCSLPDRYVPLALHGEGRRCPFAAVCASAGSAVRFDEHVFETDYY